MRVLKLILVLAAVQVGTLGAIATLLAGCTDPQMTEPDNQPATLGALTVTPTVIAVRESAIITGSVSGVQYSSWSLSVDPGPVTGTFSVASRAISGVAGIGGVDSPFAVTFTASTSGDAVIRATLHRLDGGTSFVTVNLRVTFREG